MAKKTTSFRLVTNYGLKNYPCGLAAGEKVRLKKDVTRTKAGEPTGAIHARGQVWTVLSGVDDEPEVIWLRRPEGERNTWDAGCFFDSFERVAPKDA